MPFLDSFPGCNPERFAEFRERNFSFFHFGADLFEPTRDFLMFFYPRMSRGGIVLCDYFGFGSCPGTSRAVDGLLGDKPEPVVDLAAGGAFMIKLLGAAFPTAI